jgi:hypothetical protein
MRGQFEHLSDLGQSEQLPDLVAKGAGAERRQPPHFVLIDVGQSAVRELVPQLV